MINWFKDDYWFLSNFYRKPVIYDNVEYPSVEHAYQASKTLNVSDRRHICLLKRPGEAKKYGSEKIVLRSDWNKVKVSIMYSLVKQKFNNNYLKNKLLSTNPHKILEGNYWHDNFWGDCNCPKCENINGSNYLGKILMLIRSEI